MKKTSKSNQTANRTTENNKAASNTGNCREVSLDVGGYDRFYKNPLTKTFQYEYALYRAVADLFASVRCNSLCLESLKLYFSELGHKETAESTPDEDLGNKAQNGKTQEGLIDEMRRLVARDVVGHVTFPQMNICAAQVKSVVEADGTHSFIFTDGIYGFKVRLAMEGRKKPGRILAGDLYKPGNVSIAEKDSPKGRGLENAALTGAA